MTINTPLPNSYSETVKLAQDVLNFVDTHRENPLWRLLVVSPRMEGWVASIRERAAIVKMWGYEDAKRDRSLNAVLETTIIEEGLTLDGWKNSVRVLRNRTEIELLSGEYEVYKRGACQALNIDPHSNRPLREIFQEDREKK